MTKEAAMGKVVVTEFVTLDGVVEDPGGSEGFERGGWAFRFDRGPDGDRFKLDELMQSDAQLLGRRTYEGFAAAWPSRQDDAGFADRMNSMPKFVVSSTLVDPAWQNTTVVSGDLAAEIPKLAQQFDADLLVAGSAQLVQGLLAADLIDELRLMVFPVVLGAGKKLFAEGSDQRSFVVVDVKPAGATLIQTLRPVR
jgi:dihydrofolate reductase